MKKKNAINYLDKIPVCPEELLWNLNEEEIVTLEIDNKGIMNGIAQIFFGKPKVSFIHLDKLGSFVWRKIDGCKSIADIAAEVDTSFGEEAYPLYERLAGFFRILETQRFIIWAEEKGH